MVEVVDTRRGAAGAVDTPAVAVAVVDIPAEVALAVLAAAVQPLTSVVVPECGHRLVEVVHPRSRVVDAPRPSIARHRSASQVSADRRASNNRQSIRERGHSWERVRQKFNWMAAERATFPTAVR